MSKRPADEGLEGEAKRVAVSNGEQLVGHSLLPHPGTGWNRGIDRLQPWLVVIWSACIARRAYWGALRRPAPARNRRKVPVKSFCI